MPEGWGRLQKNAAVLQQGPLAPELGTADPFAPLRVNQISGGAGGEATGAIQGVALLAKLQRQT
jgi:hypothetical protein